MARKDENKEAGMSDDDWKEAIKAWRRLSPEEQRRRHLEAIPRRVARSMAMEGEPVDEDLVRELLAERMKELDDSKPPSSSETE